jgi:hypothetical protein
VLLPVSKRIFSSQKPSTIRKALGGNPIQRQGPPQQKKKIGAGPLEGHSRHFHSQRLFLLPFISLPTSPRFAPISKPTELLARSRFLSPRLRLLPILGFVPDRSPDFSPPARPRSVDPGRNFSVLILVLLSLCRDRRRGIATRAFLYQVRPSPILLSPVIIICLSWYALSVVSVPSMVKSSNFSWR